LREKLKLVLRRIVLYSKIKTVSELVKQSLEEFKAEKEVKSSLQQT